MWNEYLIHEKNAHRTKNSKLKYLFLLEVFHERIIPKFKIAHPKIIKTEDMKPGEC